MQSTDLDGYIISLFFTFQKYFYRFESTDAYGGIEICDDTSGTAKPLISALGNAFIFYNGGASHAEALRIDTNSTFSGDVVLDDGSGNSPNLKFVNGDDDNFEYYINLLKPYL